MNARKYISRRSAMGASGAILLALLAVLPPAAQAGEAISEDVELGMLQLTLVTPESNRMLVCPPGTSPTDAAGRCLSRGIQPKPAQGITPQAYVKLACPGVTIISVSLSNLTYRMGRTYPIDHPVTVSMVTSGVCDPAKSTSASM